MNGVVKIVRFIFRYYNLVSLGRVSECLCVLGGFKRGGWRLRMKKYFLEKKK